MYIVICTIKLLPIMLTKCNVKCQGVPVLECSKSSVARFGQYRLKNAVLGFKEIGRLMETRNGQLMLQAGAYN